MDRSRPKISLNWGDVTPLPIPVETPRRNTMALSVLAYNLTRVMNIVGVEPLIAAIGASIEKWRWLGHDLGFGIGIAMVRHAGHD